MLFFILVVFFFYEWIQIKKETSEDNINNQVLAMNGAHISIFLHVKKSVYGHNSEIFYSHAQTSSALSILSANCNYAIDTYSSATF